MKLKEIISATICSVIQILLFSYIWYLFVSLAIEQGRRMRGGVAYGITIYYSSILLFIIMVISSFLVASKIRLKYKTPIVLGLSILWFFVMVFPHLDEYPIRGFCFGILGVLIHLFGSLLLLLMNNKRANQNMEPIVTTPVDEVEAQSTQAHV